MILNGSRSGAGGRGRERAAGSAGAKTKVGRTSSTSTISIFSISGAEENAMLIRGISHRKALFREETTSPRMTAVRVSRSTLMLSCVVSNPASRKPRRSCSRTWRLAAYMP